MTGSHMRGQYAASIIYFSFD